MRVEGAVTEDRLLGGRVRLSQPAAGYRAAIDPVLLAAAVPARDGETVIDLGAGAGAAALCLAARVPGAAVVGLERDAALAALAARNAVASGAADRTRFAAADISAARRFGPCDHAMANPPHLPPGRAAPGRRGDAATIEDENAGPDAWAAAALAALRPGGSLTLVHRADRIDDVLAALRGRAGSIIVFPLWPKAGRAARRVLVRARKGARGPARLAAGLALHRADGRYTAEAEAVLRCAAPLDLDA